MLTGLPNRRRLIVDLERRLDADEAAPHLFVLFDLNGFKQYNDTFGHAAGDALLVRLGAKLAEDVAPEGVAYRMGGDEFCVIVPGMWDVARLGESLREEGQGFEISACFGAVAIPTQAATVSDVFKIADDRMYAQKTSARQSAGEQSSNVLLRALSERNGPLGEHLEGVAELAVAVGAKLGLRPELIHQLRWAARLHDVGKMAIPDSILLKAGTLSEEEWAFVRRHTLVGERILDGAPALGGAAQVVRSSHERYDGGGYPDALRGQRIPLGSRIIAVCDAFDAMTSGRPYRPALAVEDALDELRSCAGSQFDPTVVRAFLAAHAALRPMQLAS